jgi:hypothetical protein
MFTNNEYCDTEIRVWANGLIVSNIKISRYGLVSDSLCIVLYFNVNGTNNIYDYLSLCFQIFHTQTTAMFLL